METAMKLAIETYASLTGRTSDEVMDELNMNNKIVIQNVKKLMFLSLYKDLFYNN